MVKIITTKGGKMKKLKTNELKEVKAGALSGWAIAGIIAGITFVVGIFDGIARPFKCR